MVLIRHIHTTFPNSNYVGVGVTGATHHITSCGVRHVVAITNKAWHLSSHHITFSITWFSSWMLWARHLLKSCREAITTRHGISIASRSSHMSHHEAWHFLITSYHITSHSHHMVLIMHITSTPHSLSPTMWGVCVTVATHHITSHDITFTSCVFMDGATIYFELSQMPSQT